VVQSRAPYHPGPRVRTHPQRGSEPHAWIVRSLEIAIGVCIAIIFLSIGILLVAWIFDAKDRDIPVIEQPASFFEASPPIWNGVSGR
jgi:hypothetical protein